MLLPLGAGQPVKAKKGENRASLTLCRTEYIVGLSATRVRCGNTVPIPDDWFQRLDGR